MTSNDWAEFISLALTIPTLAVAAWVIVAYAPRIFKPRELWKQYKTRQPIREIDLLLAGICIAFIGSFADNLYWGIAWFARYIDHPITATLQADGVFTNIPFRQLSGILAGTLHIYAAIKFNDSQKWFYTWIWVSTVSFALFLYLIKYGI